jgi:hypothetical protein
MVTQWSSKPREALKADRRVHVSDPFDWNRVLGTDYHAQFGPESITSATGRLLSDQGWVTTSLVETAGTGQDFLSESDRAAPPHILTDASGDLIQSPAVFGGAEHRRFFERQMGYAPTKLVVEFTGAMTVHSADETRSGWGVVEAGGTIGVDNDALAYIRTDGTNFICRSAGDADTGAADDAAWHRFRIEFSNNVAAGTNMVEWFIDGVSQGTLDLQTDLFPCSFGMHALTTNRPALANVDIWYE